MNDTLPGAGPVDLGLGGSMSEQDDSGLQIIHIAWGGPERWLSCNGRVYVFEDHPYCGPIVLTGKTRDPSKNQPTERSPFWQHVNAWYQQGKRTKDVVGRVWCIYETQMQEARRRGRASKTPNVR